MLFVLPHLGPGGAQRVTSIVSEHLVEDGRAVAILTLLPRRAAFDLPDAVTWIQPPALQRLAITLLRAALRVSLRVLPDSVRRPLAVWRDRARGARRREQDRSGLPWTDRKRVKLIATAVHRLEPAVVMSLLTKTNVLTLLATTGVQSRVAISERNRLVRPEPARIRELRAALYPACPLVTANASVIVEELKADLGVTHARLLPNVIRQRPPSASPPDRENIIAVVARLVPQKRVELAIQAFAALRRLDRTWRLQIIGDGPESKRLRSLAAELVPPDSYTFSGHVSDPYRALERARLLILPSAFEGTSNALLEAMSCGVVPLISDEADPVGELVVEGLTGRRFGAKTAPISVQLIRLANQDDLPLLARSAREAAERFTWDHQRELWEDVLFG